MPNFRPPPDSFQRSKGKDRPTSGELVQITGADSLPVEALAARRSPPSSNRRKHLKPSLY
jgi:hypothetical protein